MAETFVLKPGDRIKSRNSQRTRTVVATNSSHIDNIKPGFSVHVSYCTNEFAVNYDDIVEVNGCPV